MSAYYNHTSLAIVVTSEFYDKLDAKTSGDGGYFHDLAPFVTGEGEAPQGRQISINGRLINLVDGIILNLLPELSHDKDYATLKDESLTMTAWEAFDYVGLVTELILPHIHEYYSDLQCDCEDSEDETYYSE